VSYFKGMMGQPAWGFPKELQKVVLKGRGAHHLPARQASAAHGFWPGLEQKVSEVPGRSFGAARI
jgi:pyruvate carboxylase